jgi:hypothetical protein
VVGPRIHRERFHDPETSAVARQGREGGVTGWYQCSDGSVGLDGSVVLMLSYEFRSPRLVLAILAYSIYVSHAIYRTFVFLSSA